MNLVPYPHIPPKLDRRRKLMPEQYKEIRRKYKKNKNMSALAREYGVAPITINRIVDDEFKEKVYKSKRDWNKRQYRCNEIFKEKKRQASLESQQYVREVNNEGIRKWSIG